MLDCVIIGTGPAGISAALTLKTRNKSFLLFGNKNLSLKVAKAEKIRNYPGLIDVTGEDMKDIFLKQLKQLDIEITEKMVTGVYDLGDHYGVLCNSEMFECKTIILTTGVAQTKVIEGEEALLGQGVSYCATCDGFLYKNKEIAVVIQDESYMEEVEYLAEIASKVYLIPLYKNASKIKDNVEVLDTKLSKISKNETGLTLSLDNQELNVSGVFFLKSAVAPYVLVPGLEAKNGHVVVNRNLETNLKGCFAAGDITGLPYQYSKAVGEGNVAAHSVLAYLSRSK